MDYQTAVRTCLSKYGTFRGRASRSEFWWFQLALTLSFFGILIITLISEGPEVARGVGKVFNAISAAPSAAVMVRRLHDIRKSGWWLPIALTGVGFFILIYWWAQPSQPEANQHGEVPEGGADVSAAAPIQPIQTPHVPTQPKPAPTNEETADRAAKGFMEWANPANHKTSG